VQGVEFYGGVEASFEVGDDAAAKHGLRIVGDVFTGDGEDYKDREEEDA